MKEISFLCLFFNSLKTYIYFLFKKKAKERKCVTNKVIQKIPIILKTEFSSFVIESIKERERKKLFLDQFYAYSES